MEEAEARLKYFESQTPRFFKIILHDTLQNGILGIPKSFIRKYGTSLCSNKIFLRVPSGDLWEVELIREEDGGDMWWLRNGWQEFVEFYDIKFGHFLVFGYQGNSQFQVLIFDWTTSEIKYPYRPKHDKEHNADVGPCLFSVKPEIEETDAQMLVNHNPSRINESDKNTDCTGKGSRDYDHVNGELGTPTRFSPNKSREKAEAIIRSTALDSPNPYFRITMRTTYVNKNYALHLPGKFITDHIGQRIFYLKLSVPCGRFWILKCHVRMRGNEHVARIQQGWKSFVKDNNLALGDVCIFELIDNVKVHFQVTIFRVAADRSCSSFPVKSEFGGCNVTQGSQKAPCHEVSSSIIPYATTSSQPSKNPSFKLFMTEARVKSSKVPVLAGFVKHLKPGAQVMTLKVAGRLWHVKVCFYRRRAREAFFLSRLDQLCKGKLSASWRRMHL